MMASPQEMELDMDNDTNLAAWMIGGGLRNIDPSEARNRIHRRALAETRIETPNLIGRLVAATIGTVRPAASPVETACCPA